jgi:hypothetical protein
MIFTTCTITPYTLAFPEIYTEQYYIFDMIMNVIFVVDMFICFISAYYDVEFKIVDDFKVNKLSFKHFYRKLRLSTSMGGSFWTLSLFFRLISS